MGEPNQNQRPTSRPRFALCFAVAIGLLAMLLPADSAQAALQQPIEACVEPTGNPGNDQTSINVYNSSFNRDLMGETRLMSAFTGEGADPTAFVPVLGRGNTVAVADAGHLSNDFPGVATYDAVGPRSYRWIDAAAEAVDPVVGPHDSHAHSVFKVAASGPLGARGATSWHSFSSHGTFASLARNWARVSTGQLDGLTSDEIDFLSSYELPDVTVNSTASSGSRELEYLVDVHNIMVVYAVGNGPTQHGIAEVPFSAAAMYNTIAVGGSAQTWPGGPQTGPGQPGGVGLQTSYTTRSNLFYGTAGRHKPDLVVSTGNPFSSFHAPAVAGFWVRLKEAAACRFGSSSDALRSEVLKSVLLAGANQKGSFVDTTHSWDRTTERPMDPESGAGTADIASSYEILAAGELDALAVSGLDPATVFPGAPQAICGWDYGNVDPGATHVIAMPGSGGVNVSATWPYEVTNTELFNAGRLADIDLELFALIGGEWISVQRSESPIDNVEYLSYDADDDVALYGVAVKNRSAFPAEVGLAWIDDAGIGDGNDVRCLSEPPVEYVVGDVDCDGLITIQDARMVSQYAVLLRTDTGTCPVGDLSSELNASLADMDGDGEVTIQDARYLSWCAVGLREC